MTKPAPVEQRKSPMRRQWNEAFCDPNGRFAITKFIAVWGQIAVLFHFGRAFDELISRPETMLIVLAFIICPDLLKKVISAKYGGAK